MASLIPQLAAGLPDLYRPALPIQPETPVTRARRLAAALQQAQKDAGNPDAPYPVELPSFSQYAFGTPGAFDDVQLPPVSFGGDPDKMGQVRQAGGILTDNALRSAVTGHNPDAPDWVNAGADAANTGSLTGMPALGMIKAWHASPYDFDAFDMSKVGTGQGAQSFGHGLYAAENPALSGLKGTYDREFTAKKMGRAGGELTPLDSYIFDKVRDGESDMAVLKGLAQDHPYLSFEEAQKAVNDVKGNLAKIYETGIDANPDEFLDWYKPFNEQPTKIQDAFKAALETKAGKPIEPGSFGESGQSLYTLMNAWVKHDPKAATEALRAAGIKGIRYADQGSRKLPSTPATDMAQEWLRDAGDDIPKALAAYDKHVNDTIPAHLRDASLNEIRDAISKGGKPPQQTHNYVVFDDKTIAILKKYGIAGLTAGGAAAAVARSGLPSEKTQEQSDTGRQLPVAVLGVRG